MLDDDPDNDEVKLERILPYEITAEQLMELSFLMENGLIKTTTISREEFDRLYGKKAQDE